MSREDTLAKAAEKLGEKQWQLIEQQAQTPKPEIRLVYLRSSTCPHCAAIEKDFYRYVQEHPEINLTKIDADQSAEATNLLEAVLKGKREVPTVLVNDQFTVRGDADFLPRLTVAVNLAKQAGETKEERTKWLIRQ